MTNEGTQPLQVHAPDDESQGVSTNVENDAENATNENAEAEDLPENEASELEESDENASEPEEQPEPAPHAMTREAAQLAEVCEAKKRVAEQARVVSEMTADLKEEKKALKEMEAYLYRLIDSIGRGEMELPFYDQDEAVQMRDTAPDDVEPEQIVDDAASFSVELLGLAPKLTENMKLAGLKTIGQLEHAMRTDDWWHDKIERCGPASVDKISDALFEFRQTHPVPDMQPDDEGDEELEGSEVLELPAGAEEILQGDDTDEFSALCEKWATKAAGLPAVCNAKHGWLDTLDGIAKNVDLTTVISDQQREAATNVIAAVFKWTQEENHPALQD